MSLRVATYNVHGFVGRDGIRDVRRVADVLREIDADVVALQEVDSRGSPQRLPHPLRELAARVGGRAVAGPTITRDDGDYGNALLLRSPVVDVRRHDLSVPDREARGALDVVLTTAVGQTLQVVATHLGLRSAERLRQVRRLCRLAAEDLGVAGSLLLADTNEWWPWSRAVRELRRWFEDLPAVRSFPSHLPVLPLDRIGCSPAGVLSPPRAHGTPLSRVASDHLPVVAELELDRSSRGGAAAPPGGRRGGRDESSE